MSLGIQCCDLEDDANIFSTPAGTVVAVEGNAAPILLKVDGSLTFFNSLRAIATSVSFQAQAGHQFTHAMRNTVYLYTFTERVGELTISGLAFPGECEHHIGSQDSSSFGSQYSACLVTATSGLERIIQWYECNSITARAKPITIALGPTLSYDTFLVSVKADIPNADTGITQFTYRFAVLPHLHDGDEHCFRNILS